MSLEKLNLKREFRSFQDDIVESFYIPTLSNSILYQRAVGFFSSSALSSIAPGINCLIENGGKVEIIASPKLSKEDIEEIKKGYQIREIIENSILREMENVPDDIDLKNLSYLASLVADNKLDIKIASLSRNNGISMYHEKFGIITDEKGNSVAFSGSMNESENAFLGNYESFDVFCSWTSDYDRVCDKKMAFDAIWNDYEPGIQTIPFPEAAKERLLQYYTRINADERIETENTNNDSRDEIRLPEDFEIRDYQKTAISNWKNNNYVGIYDMATGTGKTLTALASAEQLYRDNRKRLAVVIVCPYQHLVEQWVLDIKRFGIEPIIGYSTSPQKEWKSRLEESIFLFNLNSINSFCFVTTNSMFCSKKIHEYMCQLKKDTLIIIDEAHNMGATNYQKYLPENIPYRLALSATISRHNDIEGTACLVSYFKKKCIIYTLQDAIRNKMLTPYYYYPVIVYLKENELDQYIEITQKISQSIKEEDGKIIISEYAKRLLIQRSQKIAGAEEKIPKLIELMKEKKNDNHILVYCGATNVINDSQDSNEIECQDIRQIDSVVQKLGNELNMKVARFTSKESAMERSEIIKKFSDGYMLQALVAIKCLDEGVNIPSIKTAFILASSTNPKEYIQRRGRVLRLAKGKKYANIYDFITLPFDVKEINCYQENLIQSTKGLVKREIIRMLDFSEIAENPSISNEIIRTLKENFNICEEELKGDDEDVI